MHRPSRRRHSRLDFQIDHRPSGPLVVNKLFRVESLSVKEVLFVNSYVSCNMNLSGTGVIYPVLIYAFIANMNALPGPFIQLLSLLFGNMKPSTCTQHPQMTEVELPVFQFLVWSHFVCVRTSVLQITHCFDNFRP